jgi:hypothetical protein
MGINRKQLNTVKELIFWSYANLAMAHEAVDKGKDKYDRTSFIIRNRMFTGLMNETINIGSMIDDEKVKIIHSDICAYCGKSSDISIDHLIPKSKGGTNCADNLIRVCKHCNSSKGAKDMLQWHYENDDFPSILILRRYLKLIYAYCVENNILDINITDIDNATLPFNLTTIPTDYPTPCNLKLYK